MPGRVTVAVVGGLMLSGCLEHSGALTNNTFTPEDDSYRVENPDSDTVLGPGWTAENFIVEGEEAAERTGSAYQVSFDWVTASGSVKRVKTRAVDLLMRHDSTNGAVWSRLVFIPHSMREKSLAVLAENYANSITGGRFYAGYLSDTEKMERTGTQVLLSSPIQVSGVAAHDVVFELVDLDQLEMNPDAPRTLAEVVLVGAPLKRELAGELETAYLMIGYANDKGSFKDVRGDFTRFLQGVRLDPPGTPKESGALLPTTPVALRLGLSRARAKKSCEALYEWREDGAGAVCTEGARDGFETETQVGFCSDTVCSLTYTSFDEPSTLVQTYVRLRAELKEQHGSPAETKNVPEECRAQPGPCFADGRASVQAEFKGRGDALAVVSLASVDAKAALVLTERMTTMTKGSAPAGPMAVAGVEPAPGDSAMHAGATPKGDAAAKREATTEGAAAAPALEASSCSPGSTQLCYGPGGCRGGQACADDGRRWLPCDCGGR